MLSRGDYVIDEVKAILVVIFGAFLSAIALNLFLIPAQVLSTGFTGVAQLISSLLKDNGLPGSTGIILLILNIPVVYLGWRYVGRRFTLYSVLSVAMMTIFLVIIPIEHVANDILLNAVFGGVISAAGVGLTLKWGGSTGGMDIIAMIISRMKDRPIGIYFLVMNGAIVLSAGFFFGWQKALYTLVALYVSSRTIDAIHTRHEKLTAMIVTDKASELRKAIHDQMVRGITRVPAKGGFTDSEKEMLIIVITRYELYTLEHVVREVDPNAFTNIVETAGIFGFFRREEQST